MKTDYSTKIFERDPNENPFHDEYRPATLWECMCDLFHGHWLRKRLSRRGIMSLNEIRRGIVVLDPCDNPFDDMKPGMMPTLDERIKQNAARRSGV